MRPFVKAIGPFFKTILLALALGNILLLGACDREADNQDQTSSGRDESAAGRGVQGNWALNRTDSIAANLHLYENELEDVFSLFGRIVQVNLSGKSIMIHGDSPRQITLLLFDELAANGEYVSIYADQAEIMALKALADDRLQINYNQVALLLDRYPLAAERERLEQINGYWLVEQSDLWQAQEGDLLLMDAAQALLVLGLPDGLSYQRLGLYNGPGGEFAGYTAHFGEVRGFSQGLPSEAWPLPVRASRTAGANSRSDQASAPAPGLVAGLDPAPPLAGGPTDGAGSTAGPTTREVGRDAAEMLEASPGSVPYPDADLLETVGAVGDKTRTETASQVLESALTTLSPAIVSKIQPGLRLVFHYPNSEEEVGLVMRRVEPDLHFLGFNGVWLPLKDAKNGLENNLAELQKNLELKSPPSGGLLLVAEIPGQITLQGLPDPEGISQPLKVSPHTANNYKMELNEDGYGLLNQGDRVCTLSLLDEETLLLTAAGDSYVFTRANYWK